MPNTLGHPDNYIPANSDVTPEHIVPEWYFLPFYAILRSIPDKALGVLALLASIIILILLPYVHKATLRSSSLKPILFTIVLIFIAICVLLGYLGGKPIEQPFLFLGQLCTAGYFSFFIIIVIVERLDYYFLMRFLFENKQIIKKTIIKTKV